MSSSYKVLIVSAMCLRIINNIYQGITGLGEVFDAQGYWGAVPFVAFALGTSYFCLWVIWSVLRKPTE